MINTYWTVHNSGHHKSWTWYLFHIRIPYHHFIFIFREMNVAAMKFKKLFLKNFKVYHETKLYKVTTEFQGIFHQDIHYKIYVIRTSRNVHPCFLSAIWPLMSVCLVGRFAGLIDDETLILWCMCLCFKSTLEHKSICLIKWHRTKR